MPTRSISKVRTLGNYNYAEVSDATGLRCEDPSRTVQSQEPESNINNIVRDFGVTGKVPTSIRAPMYGDFTGLSDYRECLDAIRAADASFALLPSELRARLGNDPARFVDWCADANNLEEMRKLGLASPVAPSASEAS